MAGQRGEARPALPDVPAIDVDDILAAVEDRLRRDGSSIVADPDRVAQLRAQIETVLADVAAQYDRRPAGPAPASGPALSAAIGTSRAAHRVPPTESLHAAETLFEAALTAMVRSLPGRRTGEVRADEVQETALRLHRSIMRRLVDGSVSYVDFLLRRIQSSHHDERRRIARELHDRAAHGVAVALQHLQLHELHAEREPDRAAAHLRSARDALGDATTTIREISVELRATLVDRDLRRTLTGYLNRRTGPEVRTSVLVTGDQLALPLPIAEQLYLVLREAVHNALLHADPSSVDVRVEIGDAQVVAEVRDDGIGFEPTRTGGVGLSSMRERLELLGGTFTVSSVVGSGSGVRVVVPLPGGAQDGRPGATGGPE